MFSIVRQLLPLLDLVCGHHLQTSAYFLLFYKWDKKQRTEIVTEETVTLLRVVVSSRNLV